MKVMRRWWWWGLMFGFGIYFWIIGMKIWDPDLGWHLQLGKLILEKGIPATDPFSYTMPSFRLIAHEWLSSVWLYFAYQTLGKSILAMVYAGLTTLALFIVIPKNLRRWAIIPLFLAAGIVSSFTGIRPQVESWLGLAIIFRLNWSQKLWRKWRWIIPLFFLVWANLHGGFVLGLASLGWIMWWQFLEERKLDVKNISVWLFSAAATIINPYGLRLWYEVWLTMSDGGLRWSIVEWQPFFITLDLCFLNLGVMFIIFQKKVKKKLEWWKIALIAVLLLAGMISIRNQAFFALISIPIVGSLLKYLYDEVAVLGQEARHRAIIFFRILLGVAGVLLMWQVGWRVVGLVASDGEQNIYPDKAVRFLKQSQIQNNIFSSYNWGGYLVWNYPEKKVFIDGRMPSWRWGLWPENSTAPKGESNWAFKDYQKIVGEGDYEEQFRKYSIDTILWPKADFVEDKRSDLIKRIDEFIRTNILKKKKKVSLVERLKEEGKKIYEDDVAVIYEIKYKQ